MSIITEALKKVEKERNKIIASKEYLNKIIGPERTSSFKNEVSDAVYKKRSKALVISGVLLLLTIIFLIAANVFLAPSFDIKIAEYRQPAGLEEETSVAEAYTDMKPDITLIEGKTVIIDRMSKILESSSVRDEFMSNFKLSGIVYDTDDSWAIVNDKIVREGDILDDATIMSIATHKVVFLFKDEIFDLKVK